MTFTESQFGQGFLSTADESMMIAMGQESGKSSPPVPTLRAIVPKRQWDGAPVLQLSRAITVIGSSPKARLRLATARVSRCHAVIVNTGGGLYIRDLASRTRVHVNREAVREIELRNGDVLEIAGFRFNVSEPAGGNLLVPALPAPPAVLDMDDSVAPVPIKGHTVLIGRRASCDIAVIDSAVSKAHSLIFEMNGRHWVRDLDSRTGTLLNGAPVREQELKHGDVVSVGGTELRYLEIDAPLLEQAARKPAAASRRPAVPETPHAEPEPVFADAADLLPEEQLTPVSPNDRTADAQHIEAEEGQTAPVSEAAEVYSLATANDLLEGQPFPEAENPATAEELDPAEPAVESYAEPELDSAVVRGPVGEDESDATAPHSSISPFTLTNELSLDSAESDLTNDSEVPGAVVQVRPDPERSRDMSPAMIPSPKPPPPRREPPADIEPSEDDLGPQVIGIPLPTSFSGWVMSSAGLGEDLPDLDIAKDAFTEPPTAAAKEGGETPAPKRPATPQAPDEAVAPAPKTLPHITPAPAPASAALSPADWLLERCTARETQALQLRCGIGGEQQTWRKTADAVQMSIGETEMLVARTLEKLKRSAAAYDGDGEALRQVMETLQRKAFGHAAGKPSMDRIGPK